MSSFQNWVQDVYGLNGGQHYTSFTQVNDPITHVGKDDFWNPDLAGFAQDSWRFRPNLLLSFGVRYDVQLVPQPLHPNTTSALASIRNALFIEHILFTKSSCNEALE